MTRYRCGLCGWLGSMVFPIHVHVDVVGEHAGMRLVIIYEYHYVITEPCPLPVVYKEHDYIAGLLA